MPPPPFRCNFARKTTMRQQDQEQQHKGRDIKRDLCFVRASPPLIKAGTEEREEREREEREREKEREREREYYKDEHAYKSHHLVSFS